jgi:hypothetical protein
MTVIRQSRPKLALLFVLFSAFTVVLAFMTFVSVYLPDLWAYLGVAFFAPVGIASAIAAASSGLSLAQPGTLTADESGLCHRSFRHERRYPWADIAEFIVFAPTSRLRSPGCRLVDGVPGRRFVSFGRSWEKTPEEIVEEMKGEMEIFTANLRD